MLGLVIEELLTKPDGMDHTKAVQSFPTARIMAYVTFENPYPNEPEFLTPAVLKRAYGTVMDQMPERIENISS